MERKKVPKAFTFDGGEANREDYLIEGICQI